MKVSAIIPAYNSAKFIKDAIFSIQKQTLPVEEIIVVDDGSTDFTQQVVHSIKGNIHYIKQVNQGPSAARNTGIKAANCDWIAFLDADDQWTTRKLEKQIQAYKNTPDLNLIAGDMSEIDINDNILEKSVLNKHHLLEYFADLNGRPIPNAFVKLLKKNFIPTGTVLVNKNALVEAGLFNENIRFGEDLELWAKIASQNSITCLPNVLMIRRQHSNNSTKYTEAMLKDLIKVMESLKDFSRQKNISNYHSNQSLAEAYNNLGYWYFDNGQLRKARQVFFSGLKQKFTKRGGIYWSISFLPNMLVARLRKLKHLI